MKKFLFSLLSFLTLSAMHASAQGGSSQVPATETRSSQDPTAQGASARWCLGLAAGPAFPVGAFHRSSSAYGGSIVAQNGGSAELSGSYRFWRSFSATLVVEGQENRGNGIAYWFFPPGSSKPAGSSKGNDWKMARILTGAVYTLPLTKKTGPALRLRLLGGVQQTISPDYKGALLYEENGVFTCANCMIPNPVAYPGLSFPWAFAYEADAGLQWRFDSRFSAVGYAGFEGSKPSINLAYFNSYNGATNTYTVDYRISAYATNTISMRAGVVYALSR